MTLEPKAEIVPLPADDLASGSEIVSADLRTRFETEALPLMDNLYAGARKFTNNNEADAQDLLQETYIKAFAAFHQFQPGTNLKAWMFRIMQNAFISNYRKAVKQPLKSSVDDLEEWELSALEEESGMSTPSAEIEALRNLPDADVMQALADLPEEFRTAVYLADAEGFSYTEIAEIIGVPLGTVMSRIHRGRKRLRVSLRDYAIDAGFLKEAGAKK